MPVTLTKPSDAAAPYFTKPRPYLRPVLALIFSPVILTKG